MNGVNGVNGVERKVGDEMQSQKKRGRPRKIEHQQLTHFDWLKIEVLRKKIT